MVTRLKTTGRTGPVCAWCGAAVFRHLLVGETRAARPVISAAPDKYGTGPVAAYRDVAGTWHARLLIDGDTPRSHERRHRVHLDECTAPAAAAARTRAAQRTAQSRSAISDRAAAVSV